MFQELDPICKDQKSFFEIKITHVDLDLLSDCKLIVSEEDLSLVLAFTKYSILLECF